MFSSVNQAPAVYNIYLRLRHIPPSVSWVQQWLMTNCWSSGVAKSRFFGLMVLLF